MPPVPRRRSTGQQLSVALAAFWRGGAGPTHDEVDVVLRGEGIDPAGLGMSKHAKVSAALAEASEQTAVDLANGLVELLRHSGYLDPSSDPEATRRQQALVTALSAVGARLHDDGSLTWSPGETAPSPRPASPVAPTQPQAPAAPPGRAAVAATSAGTTAGSTDSAGAAREVLVSWAHDANPGTDQDAWRDQVLDLATGLRARGVPAELDLFHGTDPDVDWTRWGPAAATRAETVIVAINHAWSQRWSGTNLPTVGAGAVAEADVLHGLFSRDQAEFQRRVVLVLLPGASKQDIPLDLHRLVRYTIDPADPAAFDEVLRRFTGQPEDLLPPLGPLPVLPPRSRGPLPGRGNDGHDDGHAAGPAGDTAARSVSYTRTAAEALPAPLAVASAETSSDAARLGGDREALQDRAAVLRSAARHLQPDQQAGQPKTTDDSALAREQQQVRRELAEVQAQLAALENARSSVDHAQELLGQLRASIAGPVGWLLIIALPVPGPATARLTVDSARAELQRWHEQAAPVPGLDLTGKAYRDTGRVVFTGHPAGSARHDEQSTRWRLELGDDGAIALAGALPDSAQELGGHVGFAGQPGEVLLDADLVLPVRRDTLELWLLTAVHLLAHRLGPLPAGTEVLLAAQLAVPGPDQASLGRRARSRELQLVDSPRHPDRPDDPPAPVPGSRRLPLQDLPPVELRAKLADLGDAPGRVRAARDLARQILDRFGAEDTVVLLDRTVQPRAVAVPDQQLLHQHARLHGLAVDELSPADRLAKATELRAEADELLRPPR